MRGLLLSSTSTAGAGPCLIGWAAQVRRQSIFRSETVHREFLQAATFHGLARIEIALRIRRDHMEQGEFANAMSSAAEAAENLAARMIEDPQRFIAGIDDVHVFLSRVG